MACWHLSGRKKKEWLVKCKNYYEYEVWYEDNLLFRPTVRMKSLSGSL